MLNSQRCKQQYGRRSRHLRSNQKMDPVKRRRLSLTFPASHPNQMKVKRTRLRKSSMEGSSARSTNVVTQQKPTPIVPSVSRTQRTLVPKNSIERPRRLGEERPREATTAGTIHISIGRVEVKAMIQSPASSHRASPKPSKPASMSLDDYLSRRAHGGKP